eukprot:m.157466 g.157466  ORF g.157466 m.157466 type:complete len:221 (-) comp24721_c0_seq1:39-701(-)
MADTMLNPMLWWLWETHLPHLLEVKEHERKLAFLQHVCTSTAELAAMWQSFGFVHGVLNTDNMSVLGLTLDYGPFGFVERFDMYHVGNSSDTHGRYSYARQPSACLFNVGRFSQALGVEISMEELSDMFSNAFWKFYVHRFAGKLGLPGTEVDPSLISDLLNVMHETGADFTNTFRFKPLCAHQRCSPIATPAPTHHTTVLSKVAYEDSLAWESSDRRGP